MFTATAIFSNLKTVAIMAAVGFAIWFFKDYQFQKAENERMSENWEQKSKQDSLHYSEAILSKQQMSDYLQYEKKELLDKMNSAGIKSGRVESVTTNNYYYKDTIKRSTDVSTLIASIQNSIPANQPWQDTTKCQTTKGSIIYDGKTLKVEVSDREHKNTSESVAYWERRQWKFLGIKTRFLGRIQMTAKVFDDCGESNIKRVEKQK